MCRIISRIIGCLLWPVCSPDKAVSLCPALFCTSRPNLPMTPGISSCPTFAFQFPVLKRTSFLVIEGFAGLHRTGQLHHLWHQWLGHRLGSLWRWMVALEMNWDHSVIFETAPKSCISDSLVDCEGYSISSKGFFPIVMDIMVILIIFTHSCPF